MNPTVAVVVLRIVVPPVDLELALHAAHPPGIVLPGNGPHGAGSNPALLQVDVAQDHPAHVRDVADAAAARDERAPELDGAQEHDHVLGLHGEHEEEQHDAIRIEHAEGQQQPVDRAGGADGEDVQVAGEHVYNHDGHARPNAAQEVVLQKTLGSPVLLQVGPDHPQDQHVEQNDNASATPRMTSWACSKFAIERGAEPVMQIAARDRTRAGLQGEILGASALGVRNVLCVTGDSAVLAPQPRGRMDINDLDAVQMLWILRRMRDDGRYLDGREIKFPPRYFLGAAASPFASDPKFQAMREHKKVNAGAQFFQTNLVYDIERMEIWLNELAKRNILGKVYIMIGITPLKSLKMARYMTEVPGVWVPEPILKRMEDADGAGNAQEEGVQIALELARKIKKYEKQGIHGLHIMPVGWEDIVPRIVTESGLLPESFVPSQQLKK